MVSTYSSQQEQFERMLAHTSFLSVRIQENLPTYCAMEEMETAA